VKGLTTIHAGSARQALSRLRFICQLAEVSSEIPLSALSTLVSEAVDVVVHTARRGGQLRVTEVVAVEDLQSGTGSSFTVTDVFTRERHDAPIGWTGNVPIRCARPLEEAGYDVRELLEAGRGSATPGQAVR
jgi:pilus assembly protein CpaF